MKIGILTFHRTHNYGAILQCYALQKVLLNLGYDTWVINYVQPYIEQNNNIFYHLYNKFRNHPLEITKTLIRRLCSGDSFLNFRRKYLRLTKKCDAKTIPQFFDCYIIGSDQLWSLECTGKIDSVFWGNFPHSSKSHIYGYAISGNGKSLEKLGSTTIKHYISNFSILSLREISLAQKIFNSIGYRSRIDIDPTLLTDSKIWDPLIKKSWKHRNYILVYQARYLKGQASLLIEKARKLAQKEECGIIDLSTYKYSPAEFVTAFKYAKCVVTSSFHGTAFALIFNKQLCSVKLNDGHDARYVDLLNIIGADKFIFDWKEDLNIVELDYSNINDQLHRYRQHSLKYLTNIK